MNEAEKFQKYTDVNGPIPVHVADLGQCWLWTGPSDPSGYPRVGQHARAHRRALEISLGRPLAAGMYAIHRCDTPLCVRPSHLTEGTQLDNYRDMLAKGRARRAIPLFTDAQADEIRRLVAAGATRREIQDRFGIARSTLGELVRGERYRPKAVA